jgi:hypothetical protein
MSESPTMVARRMALEETAAALARRLKREMPIGTGFCLVMYDYGGPGNMAFASTGERSSTIAMLRELVALMEQEEAER